MVPCIHLSIYLPDVRRTVDHVPVAARRTQAGAGPEMGRGEARTRACARVAFAAAFAPFFFPFFSYAADATDACAARTR